MNHTSHLLPPSRQSTNPLPSKDEIEVYVANKSPRGLQMHMKRLNCTPTETSVAFQLVMGVLFRHNEELWTNH